MTAKQDTFFRKCASFSCHVEYVEYVECFRALQGKFWPVVSKFIQHIQHIQHDSRKKHFFGGSDAT